MIHSVSHCCWNQVLADMAPFPGPIRFLEEESRGDEGPGDGDAALAAAQGFQYGGPIRRQSLPLLKRIAQGLEDRGVPTMFFCHQWLLGRPGQAILTGPGSGPEMTDQPILGVVPHLRGIHMAQVGIEAAFEGRFGAIQPIGLANRRLQPSDAGGG